MPFYFSEHLLEAYVELPQTSEMERLAKIVNGLNYFRKTFPLRCFDMVLNTLLDKGVDLIY